MKKKVLCREGVKSVVDVKLCFEQEMRHLNVQLKLAKGGL
jgi:hypothetical protein